MKLSHETMKSLLTEQLNRMLLTEKITVTSVTANGIFFDVEFYPASEKLQETLKERTDLPKVSEFKKSKKKNDSNKPILPELSGDSTE